jgi:polysaccharide pyruvyl transferase WcaK-like protein
MSMRILVYGWYGNGNLGDELFRDAFKQLMPDADLEFASKITKSQLKGIRAVVFGGGSFLYKEPRIETGVLDILMKIPTAYAGIGVENDVHEIHLALMKKSSVVAVRTQQGVETLSSKGVTAICTADIVHLITVHRSEKHSKTLLFVPNVETIPMWNAPSWATLAWERFKNETAQFLDERLESGWKISFLSMCKNARMNDLWAATEIVSKMTRRSTNFEMIQSTELPLQEVLQHFACSTVVLSQRYHGLVLSEMVDTPSISIHHHDKLKKISPFRGEKVPYYELSKRLLHEAVDVLSSKKLDPVAVDFSVLRSRFDQFLQEVRDGQVRRDS